MKNFILNHKHLIKSFLYSHLPFDEEFISKNSKNIDWLALSNNQYLDLEYDFILQNEGKFNWDVFCPIDMECFRGNGRDQRIYNFLTKFKNKLNWTLISYKIGSFENPHIMIKKFENYWDWKVLSGNEMINWDHDLIRKFRKNIDWDELSRVSEIDWSQEMIEEFDSYINWKYFKRVLPGNWDYIKITLLQDKLKEKGIDIQSLYKKASLQKVDDLLAADDIEKLIDMAPEKIQQILDSKLKILNTFDDAYDLLKDKKDLKEINFNEDLRWSEEAFSYVLSLPGIDILHLSTYSNFIDPYKVLKAHSEKLIWHEMKEKFVPDEIKRERLVLTAHGICANTHICWTLQMLDEFSDKIDWDMISEQAIDWTPELINQHFHRFTVEKVFKHHDIYHKIIFPEIDDEILEQLIG